MKPLHIDLPGFSIAGKTWGAHNNPPILALHGWLDNANSFDLIAPYFEKHFYFIAVDLPGHGYSSHLPEGCNYHFHDAIFIIIELLNALKLDKVHLLGHSMGACLASLVGGVSPERIRSLSLIEGLGPFSNPAETACQQLRAQAHTLGEKPKKPRGYDRIESAALARAFKGYVSLNIAKILCERSLLEQEGKWYWRHDQRLLTPSPLRMTETQVLSCLKEITAKTYLILSSKGFSFDKELLTHRMKAVSHLSLKEVEGGHHIHMEEPELISTLLLDFMSNTASHDFI